MDGIAYKGNTCYVVECKGWRLPHLIEEKSKKDEIIRDLKGIVLGYKYTNKNGKLIRKPRPSLHTKVQHVKSNRSLYIQSSEDFEIKGLIVISGYPPITKFDNIKIISINEITHL